MRLYITDEFDHFNTVSFQHSHDYSLFGKRSKPLFFKKLNQY